MADKRVCMTIPQQECRETQVSGYHSYATMLASEALRCSSLDIFNFSLQVPSCKPVSREECGMVPRERCAVVTSGGAGPRCRQQSRLVCEDTPRQKCGTKVGGYNMIIVTFIV